MALGEDKVMLQVSITKKQMEDLEFLSREGKMSKSDLVQNALGLMFNYLNKVAKEKNKLQKEKN